VMLQVAAAGDTVFGLLLLAGMLVALCVRVQRFFRERQRRRKWQIEQAENARLDDCRDLVLWLADAMGYVARDVISKDELAKLIDSGVYADEIAEEVLERIEDAEGIVLGYQKFADGYEFPVKQLESLRDRHTYVVGKTGYGKTTLILEMIYQGLEKGEGIGIIAPEQEMLTEGILPFIPKDRVEDAVYFNPADLDCPVCFNPLTLESAEDIDLKADENMGIFRRVVGESAGPRMEEILRQSFYALIEKPGFTLLDMERLLSREDAGFRKELLKEIKDERTIHFFEDVYPSLPKDSHLPITTRLGRFLRPRFIRNVLCQTEKNLNFRECMDQGKILLFNLSDGILGEMNAQILGQLVVSKIQLAALSRADIAPEERRKFYLYIDEFQAFVSTASASYEKILSRARKYGLVLGACLRNRLSCSWFATGSGSISQNLGIRTYG